MEEEFHVQYMEETGLVACTLGDHSIELTIEDIDEINAIVATYGRDKISKREDWL